MTYQASRMISPPGVPLVTPTQAKRWLRRDDDDDIEDITLLIDAAMSHLDGVDGILRRSLIQQDWVDIWGQFPAGWKLHLALAPVSAVASIEYYDASNVLQTLDASLYSLHQGFAGSYIALEAGTTWPATYWRDDAVEVTYTAGYGATAADVPAEIRLAAREMIEGWYGCEGARSDALPASIMKKLRRFIRPHF